MDSWHALRRVPIGVDGIVVGTGTIEAWAFGRRNPHFRQAGAYRWLPGTLQGARQPGRAGEEAAGDRNVVRSHSRAPDRRTQSMYFWASSSIPSTQMLR
jgi:hypothetical protein